MTRRKLAAATVVGAALLLPASALGAAPTVATGPARNVTPATATLTGTVNPNGGETDYYFEYGAGKSYGTKTPLTPAGNGTKRVNASASIAGLTPNSTYHYRLVAVGASTVNGGDRTFATPPIPLTASITGSPNPVLFGSPFVVDGVLSGTGNGNRQVQLQATPFPYSAPYANIGNPVVTHPDGTFSIPFVGLIQTAKLRVITTSKPTVMSPEVIEQVAVKVVLHVKKAKRRGFIRLAGTVTPPEVGAQVTIQRLTSKGPKTVGSTSVKQGTNSVGTFSASVRKVRHSLYRAVLTFPSGPYVANDSLPVLVR